MSWTTRSSPASLVRPRICGAAEGGRSEVKLLLVRHAAAVPRGTPGVPDDERPLTPQGVAKFRVAAKGLARIAHRPDVLLTSPLPRARATAAIAAQAFKRIEPTVALVGHEPTLSMVLARLLGAVDGERLAFKKGGAALVDLPDGPLGGGRLVWFLKPKVLRALAGE